MNPDELMAVIELPAGLVADGVVFMSVPDWDALWAEIRLLPGVDRLRSMDVRVHRMDRPVIETGPQTWSDDDEVHDV